MFEKDIFRTTIDEIQIIQYARNDVYELKTTTPSSQRYLYTYIYPYRQKVILK